MSSILFISLHLYNFFPFSGLRYTSGKTAIFFVLIFY